MLATKKIQLLLTLYTISCNKVASSADQPLKSKPFLHRRYIHSSLPIDMFVDNNAITVPKLSLVNVHDLMNNPLVRRSHLRPLLVMNHKRNMTRTRRCIQRRPRWLRVSAARHSFSMGHKGSC